MHLASKHEPEASFSFQINDAVKGDEEYLLAEDDFLRDVSDYTLTTPALHSRPKVLEHDKQLTLHHPTGKPDNHDATAPASSPPKSFAPSSQSHPNTHRDEAAVTKRLKTPKPTLRFPSKLSKPKTSLDTRSTTKWPSTSRELDLPRPEASPAVARLTNLRAEIEMLGENDGLFHDPAQQQQDGHSSNRRTESENLSPLNSNIPTPTKLESTLPIEEEALMDEPEPGSVSPLLTQSIPTSGPIILSSSGPFDDTDELVSPSVNENCDNSSERQDGMDGQKLTGDATFGNAVVDGATSPERNEELDKTEMMSDDDSRNNPVPLTLSQLSPRKSNMNVNLYGQNPSSSTAIIMSPMRPPRKRPASTANDHQTAQNKKGKMMPRTTRSQVTTSKEGDVQNSSRPIRRKKATLKADMNSQGNMARRLVSSGSGSRLRVSRLASLTTAAAASSVALVSTSGQRRRSQRIAAAQTEARAESDASSARMGTMLTEDYDGVAEMRCDAGDADENDTVGSHQRNAVAPSSAIVPESSLLPLQEKTHRSKIASASNTNGEHDATERSSRQDTTVSHVNATKSVDFQFQFRPEEKARVDPITKQGFSRTLRSQSRSQRAPGASLLGTSNSTLASSSSSNSRSIASMTRSQFKYIHHRPVPDYKAQHSLLESSRAHRNENVAPVIPLSFELHTDARARDREKFNAMMKEKAKEMERETEAKRKEREEREEREVRELRRRAVPKANVVPEWYKDAPRPKRVRR